MKKWHYSLSTNTIWTNFDCGEVEAETKEEAKEKAIAEIKSELKIANALLDMASLSISMDFSNIEITEQ